MTTVHKGWTQDKVNALTSGEAAALRTDLSSQSMSRDASERRDAFGLLKMLSSRTDGARSVEERAADAAEFLSPGPSASTRKRAFDVAVSLYGSEREAERRGYKRPAA